MIYPSTSSAKFKIDALEDKIKTLTKKNETI